MHFEKKCFLRITSVTQPRVWPMTRSLPMSFASSWHLWSISESISHPWLPSELCMKRFVSPSVCSETTGCTRKQQVKKQRCASQIKCWKVSIWKACATWGCSICVYIDKHLSISNTKGYYPWTLYIHNIEVMFHIYFAYICMVIIYIHHNNIIYIYMGWYNPFTKLYAPLNTT